MSDLSKRELADYALVVRAAASHAEYEDDRRELMELFDRLEALEETRLREHDRATYVLGAADERKAIRRRIEALPLQSPVGSVYGLLDYRRHVLEALGGSDE